MAIIWITAMSTHIEAVANSFIAACEEGYVPDEVYILSNPSVKRHLAPVCNLIRASTDAYGCSEEAKIAVTELERETDFEAIVQHIREPIVTATDEDTIAVDVTPGRKFMSAIAFQAGITFDADHVYYLHLDSDRYFGKLLPDIPRTAVRLIDFREVF